MKKLFILIFLSAFVISCSTPFLKYEQNKVNMSGLQIGMTQDQILDIMGYPYKTEEKICDSITYDIWYYITEPSILGQTKLVTRNFTPLVFESGILVGWGRNFYKYTFNVNNAKWKRQIEKKQQYTNDKKEWPRNEHATIPPMNEPKEKPSNEQGIDTINQTILDLEKSSDTQQEQPRTNQAQPDQKLQQNNTSKQQTNLNTDKTTQTVDKKQLKKPDRPEKKSKEPCKPSTEQDFFILWE